MNSKSSFDRLIEELKRLPGIGQKTAQRLAFFLLKMPPDEAKGIAGAIIDVKDKSRFCSVCNNITEEDTCRICRDVNRDRTKVLVVEEPGTLYTIERTRGYKGLYHVMLGALSPLDGIGPDDIKINGLISRVENDGIKEVILAMDPDMAGEATAMYLTRLIKPMGVHVTRIAYGIPVGSDIEYADEVTLVKSLEGRREV
ncbi:MAG TPA: recombination protein RecR [Nitrospiraceae bacterium]|nr:recombination protein RecR [Nitrospiraceae bacterium]HBI22983.1 recombination protein RecR [Nitrospiraceae bacterium]